MFTRTAIRLIALSLLLTLGTAVSADPAAAPAETRAATVALGDLDLTSIDGARQALARVTKAAQRLCGTWSDSLKAANRRTQDACVRETVADTVRQVKSPALAALAR